MKSICHVCGQAISMTDRYQLFILTLSRVKIKAEIVDIKIQIMGTSEFEYVD